MLVESARTLVEGGRGDVTGSGSSNPLTPAPRAASSAKPAGLSV